MSRKENNMGDKVQQQREKYQFLPRVMHVTPLQECLNQFEELHNEYHDFCNTEPDRYDTLDEYLCDVFTENEIIECLHTLSSCNCCEKHTGKSADDCSHNYPSECECWCRHNRRWIYRCLSKYDSVVREKHDDENNVVVLPSKPKLYIESVNSDTYMKVDKNDYGYWV